LNKEKKRERGYLNKEKKRIFEQREKERKRKREKEVELRIENLCYLCNL